MDVRHVTITHYSQIHLVSIVRPIFQVENSIYITDPVFTISMKVKTGHTGIVDQDVYVLLSKIPSGKVSTYGDIARALGHPKAARAIGRIIANNPNPISIPCHRVVKSNGELGGFAYGEQMKREILEKEGIKFQNRIVENFEEQRLSF
jgi:methylated-DNA-[protein]-cysteine S-methyltransferase